MDVLYVSSVAEGGRIWSDGEGCWRSLAEGGVWTFGVVVDKRVRRSSPMQRVLGASICAPPRHRPALTQGRPLNRNSCFRLLGCQKPRTSCETLLSRLAAIDCDEDEAANTFGQTVKCFRWVILDERETTKALAHLTQKALHRQEGPY